MSSTNVTSVNADRVPAAAKPGLKLRLEDKLGFLRNLCIVPYHGHGTQTTLQIKGRVLEAPGLEEKLSKPGRRLHNFLSMVRNLTSDEIPGALLRAEFAGQEHEVYTDSEGYFMVNLWLPGQPLSSGWHEVKLTLVDAIGSSTPTATARALVPPEDADFMVVSDLDDTVIESSVFNRLTHIKLTLFKDAAGRTPVEGVAPLYQKLVKGPSGNGNNPIFYLSRSGWNLNQLFEDFLAHHGLPPGPMYLRDLAFREAKSIALGSEHHKLDHIRALLRTYERLPLVLIGDSGQGDPENYWQIAMENPERVKAIYLHDVGKKRRDREVELIARDLRKRKVPVIHAVDVGEYAPHMMAINLIKPEANTLAITPGATPVEPLPQ